ncbi:hypothetical protein VTK56DRAFT_5505 [Thermocarpiscus australiensis]
MDEFVNWDHADPASGGGAQMPSPALLPSGEPLHDLDLALANVAGDDFSFWALQHFENNISPALGTSFDIPMPADRTSRRFEDHLQTPDAPCDNCRLGGYDCKLIPEGDYKGYCTSCVALRCACSFGLAAAFPANPWPVLGDHPEAIAQEDAHAETHQSSATANPTGSASASGPESASASAGPRAKVGARFSRESVKILKNWLSTHSKHPYPNEEEKEMLQKQTGLSKTQITNWLANTRRRNKNAAGQRSTSPGVRNWASPIDIPKRPGTPAFEHMNPLQRWQHSPPEHEPASVTAIARAISASSTTSISSGLNSPYSLNFTDDGSGRSLCASTISSANTSHSSTSVYSFGSKGSYGSQGSLPRGRRRRRRKAPAAGSTPNRGPPKTFQCTFCTDTFRTKHDWQRHEKSLHLSLERWVCSPNGPQAFNPENGQISCVFCGHPNPDEDHIDSHNYSACQERTLGERTFYRKDHLCQHLRLVHGVTFENWSMEQWKVTTPEIRSRCGFCGIILDTWSIRVDHIAEHFKKGKSMADWKGGWGFDAPVMDMVENSIPPYLIHDERNSMDPYTASKPSSTSARNAFELIKTELMFYIEDYRDKEGKMPSDQELQRAACALVYKSDDVAQPCFGSKDSWLRDLLFSSVSLAQEAKWARVASVGTRQQVLRINGKGNIFELDPMETKLHEFVKARRLLGLTAMNGELQNEACNIIRRMEETSNDPCDEVTQFLIRLVNSSTEWLAGFRQRAHLPRSEDIPDEAKRSKDPTTIDSTVHNPSRLDSELAEYVREQRSQGIEPTDADLQRKARIIIYEYDDGWNQTAADDPVWLSGFKQRHGLSGSNAGTVPSDAASPDDPAATDSEAWRQMQPSVPPSDRGPPGGAALSLNSGGSSSGASSAGRARTGMYYLSDANCYLRLAHELKKFVASTMSPNNPNCHIPSDEELQHQARWIVYEDDDPWNQTAADNAEWLRRFKRDVGLLTDPSLPGLPLSSQAWNIAQGGSGFAPPYLFPNPRSPMTTFAQDADTIPITVCDGAKPFAAPASTANRFVQGLVTRHSPPPAVFCSRELEKELAEFVTAEVVMRGAEGFPSDEAIRERARAVLKTATTAADDEVLLGKFKEMMRGKLGMGASCGGGGGRGDEGGGAGRGRGGNGQAQQGQTRFAAPGDVDMSGVMSGAFDEVFQHMDFDFDLGDFVGGAAGGMAAEGGMNQF